MIRTKFTEFLYMLSMVCELQYKRWITRCCQTLVFLPDFIFLLKSYECYIMPLHAGLVY